MNSTNTILCIGEVLWDALPEGLFLGGAPLNVCCHLNRFGMQSEIVSRVGYDKLGREALRRIKRKGIATDLIQTDPELETGFVTVELNDRGEPEYEIQEPVAWDHIEYKAIPKQKLASTRAIVFGSLAQRGEVSRQTIRKLLDVEYDTNLSDDTVMIFDMNLRPPYDDRELVEASLHRTDILKLNEEELKRVIRWFSLPDMDWQAVERLANRFDCSTVCVTRGGEGAALYLHGQWVTHGGYTVRVADTVGSGDAFLAALIYGIDQGATGNDLLKLANAAGAYVAQKEGATPDYDVSEIMEMAR